MSDLSTPPRYKLSIEDYHKLGEAGILNEDSRVELIEGELIQMAPIDGPHMWAVNHLNRLLVSAVGSGAVVSPQNSVTLPPDSEPQPDFTLLRVSAALDKLPPRPSDVLLIVEVSDTTLAYDRGRKLQLYASAGLPEFWVVDVIAQQVEVYTQPEGNGYRMKSIVRPGERLHPQALPEAVIEVAAIFA